MSYPHVGEASKGRRRLVMPLQESLDLALLGKVIVEWDGEMSALLDHLGQQFGAETASAIARLA